MAIPRSAATTLHENQLEPLVRRTLAGERRAWGELWIAIDPTIEAIAGRFRVSNRPAAQEDERRNVVVCVMERLHEHGFARLRTFHEVLQRRDGSFRAWLAVMTRRTALNYARDHAENLGDTAAHRRWIQLLPLPEDVDDEMPISARAVQTMQVARVQAYMEKEIPPAPREALRLWLLGHAHDEIAGALGLATAHDADLLVRLAIMTLRRHFSEP